MSTADPRHVIAPAGLMEDTVVWLEWHGYRVGLVQPAQAAMEIPFGAHGPVFGGTKYVGKAGVLFGRKNEPLFLAQVGDVLVWDGQNVKIEE